MSLKDKLLKLPKSIRFNTDRSDYLDEKDIKFMSSLDAAVHETSKRTARLVLWVIFFVVVFLLVWANYAEIDEITRGSGKIITSNQIQKVQYLEGGIISEIAVKEGDSVEQGQILLKLDDVKFSTQFEKSVQRLYELKAKAFRLLAQSENKEVSFSDELNEQAPKYVRDETNLFETNMEQLKRKIDGAKEQIKQKRNDLENAKSRQKDLQVQFDSIEKELEITRPLVDKGVVSKVEFLQLQREYSRISSELESVKISIPKLESIIQESKNKQEEIRFNFKNSSQKEYNECVAEIARVEEDMKALGDKVGRTVVRSPVKGMIKRVLVNTIGGVVNPGRDLIEIVPTNENLLAEVKIRPSDIAFLYPGQEAVVKFTAYDFSIYGGLRGKVTHISADTITDEKGDSYYLVKVATDKSYLGNIDKNLNIIVGMTVNVDILTGKKSVLDYLLKPILKAKYNALRER